MRTLNELTPDYEDQVEIVIVSIDLTEPEERITSFLEDNSYVWEPAIANRDILADYRVVSRSTKIGVDRDGVIAYRGGYGRISREAWQTVLSDLTE